MEWSMVRDKNAKLRKISWFEEQQKNNDTFTRS